MTAAAAAPLPAQFGGLLRRAVPLGVLLFGTLVLGMAGQSAARPFFILGCALVGWDLLRLGAAAHLCGSVVLFAFAPFLRRVVDAAVGYDQSGLMISGPLLALLIVTPRLMRDLSGARRLPQPLWPFVIFAACVLYAVFLTIIGGNLNQAASNVLKWGAPLLYGMWLYGEAERGAALIRKLTGISMVVAPLIGLYGFLQYVDPPAWDRFWMSYTSIASIGQPLPFMVRVFSTMNAPAGYATFTAAALLLFGFGRARFTLLLAAAPSVLGLLLSMYRTAWIALGVGIVVGLFHGRTWRRAAMLLAAVPLLGVAVVLYSPAGDALMDRFSTFGNAGSDASGQERLGEYAELLNADGGTLIGNGFAATDVMQAGALALDGQFVIAWSAMGLVVGIVSVAALIWVAVQAVRGGWRAGSLEGVAVAGIMVGMLVQMPLAVVSTSETGFLFWSLAAIGAAMGRVSR